MEIKRDKRTEFNLENILKMAFHYKGFRNFAEGTINELNLEGSRAGKFLRFSSSAADLVKYLMLAAIPARMIYDYFAK